MEPSWHAVNSWSPFLEKEALNKAEWKPPTTPARVLGRKRAPTVRAKEARSLPPWMARWMSGKGEEEKEEVGVCG